MSSVPIITLTVERMQHEVSMMLTQHTALIDSTIQDAIKGYLTRENISRIVRESVESQTEAALRDAIDRFFNYGDGRKGIDAAVKQALGKVQDES